jgi:hypothetical protein
MGTNSATTGLAYGLAGLTSSVSGIGLYGRALSTTGTTVGLTGDADSTSGRGIMGRATSTSGTTMGIYAEARSAGGTALVVNNTASGKLLSGQANGVEKFSVDGSGNFVASGSVTASSFSGGGTGLTGVNASDLTCAGCVAEAELSFGVATQAELDAESSARSAGDATLQTNLNSEASTRAARDTALSVRGINYLAGCDSCDVLDDTDDQRAIYANVVGPMTINSVTCFSDAGTPTINLQRDDGTPANILSSDLTCSTTGATSTSFSGAENSLGLNHKLDFAMVTAGGVAKRVTVVIKATLN